MAEDRTGVLATAGLSQEAAQSWVASYPDYAADLEADAQAATAFWNGGAHLLASLPEKSSRNDAEKAAANALMSAGWDNRDEFLQRHALTLYDQITDDCHRHLRFEPLLEAAAAKVPSLVPSEGDLAAERTRILAHQEGLEKFQGLFLSHILADPRRGTHLIQAMLMPKEGSAEQLEEFRSRGRLELDGATVERQGKAVVVTMRNPRYLNAIDMTNLPAIETAVDVAILDPESEIAVLRGAIVDHPKYAGKRIFSAGVNLTHLYKGQIPFLFYFLHQMGFENKIYRGVARTGVVLDDIVDATVEKGWIATVDTFAIGGGCQHLLVMDYVLAGKDSYLTLPARKEGIIPGAANMRLPRFIGDRAARQAILYDRRIDCDSETGRLMCDETVQPDRMDEALATVIDGLTTSGIVSIVSNRRQLRLGQEPTHLFRQYMALEMREQAQCHFSRGLIDNLERFWRAHERKG